MFSPCNDTLDNTLGKAAIRFEQDQRECPMSFSVLLRNASWTPSMARQPGGFNLTGGLRRVPYAQWVPALACLPRWCCGCESSQIEERVKRVRDQVIDVVLCEPDNLRHEAGPSVNHFGGV
jgi:hypothetical protein